jgi:tetratricopeptide (TPR) repeat protein
MNESQHNKLIAAWLDGALTPEEQIKFESKMKNDPAFAREVSMMEALRDDSRSFYSKEALVDRIVEQNRKQVRRPLWRQPAFRIGLALAAGLALFFALSPLIFNDKAPDHQVVFAQYFEAYDESGLSVERGNKEDSSQSWQSAADAYRQGDYATAISGFEQIVQNDSAQITARFYLANSLLALGNTSEAIEQLQFIIGKNSFLYDQQARWFLALAYVQAAQPNRAIPLLEQLQTEKGALAEKAKALLEDIR